MNEGIHMRWTYLATRLRDGATIIIPNRRHRRGTTTIERDGLSTFTNDANNRAEAARRAQEGKNA